MSISVHCATCGRDTVFEQPYRFHAGFSEQGFLYNDAGDLTFIWSMYDPLMRQLFPPQTCPWAFTQRQQQEFEQLLKPAPTGGRWSFGNSARCPQCHSAISAPMLKDIYYVRFPSSINADESGGLQHYVVEEDLTNRSSEPPTG